MKLGSGLAVRGESGDLEQARVRLLKHFDEIEGLKPGEVVKAPLHFFVPNKKQPRKHFDVTSLKEMGESLLAKKDVDEFLRVQAKDMEQGWRLLIVSGERRWRSANLAVGVTALTCVIERNLNEEELFVASFRGNLHRKDLSVIEEANVFETLVVQFKWPVARIAKEFGISEAHIGQLRKLLFLNKHIARRLLLGFIPREVAAEIASFDKQQQMDLHKELVIIEGRSDRKMSYADKILAIRKIAKNKGYARRNSTRKASTGSSRKGADLSEAQTTRGRQAYSVADKTATELAKSCNAFMTCLLAFQGLKKPELASITSVNLHDLMTDLEKVLPVLQRQTLRLQNMVD